MTMPPEVVHLLISITPSVDPSLLFCLDSLSEQAYNKFILIISEDKYGTYLPYGYL